MDLISLRASLCRAIGMRCRSRFPNFLSGRPVASVASRPCLRSGSGFAPKGAQAKSTPGTTRGAARLDASNFIRRTLTHSLLSRTLQTGNFRISLAGVGAQVGVASIHPPQRTQRTIWALALVLPCLRLTGAAMNFDPGSVLSGGGAGANWHFLQKSAFFRPFTERLNTAQKSSIS